MAIMIGNAIGGGVDRVVRWVILPVTGIIPVLVRTGLLFLAFAALWFGFFVALVVDPAVLTSAQHTIEGLPLIAQGLAWLLFLPLMGGLWVWTTDWPLVARVALVAGIAGWNLIVFIPRRETTSPVASS
jgi:hypothetical protein